MSHRIAYLENGKSRDEIGAIPERMEARGLCVDFYWASRSEFPANPENYSGIFLSGSAHGAYEDIDFIHKEHDFIRQAAKTDVAMLGVCFGSQILASALCGKDQVFRRTSCHVGFLELKKTAAARDDALMRGLPAQIRMLIWHNDQIKDQHPDMTLLATTQEAANQIWRYQDRNIWGIQGHPEVTAKNARLWLNDVRDSMVKDGVDVDILAEEIDQGIAGTKMIDNFISVCLGHSALNKI